MNPGAIVWQCHGCGAIRDDDWISVAHRKFMVAPESVPMQISLRYCNDRSRCLVAVAGKLDQIEARIREGMGLPPPTGTVAVDRHWEIPVKIDSAHVENAITSLIARVRDVGGDLCVNDAGRWVVVPMSRPVEVVRRALAGIHDFIEVGEPIHFDD